MYCMNVFPHHCTLFWWSAPDCPKSVPSSAARWETATAHLQAQKHHNWAWNKCEGKCTQADWSECAAVLKQMMVKYGTALTVAQHAESIQDFSEELGHGRQGFQLDLLEVFRTFVFKVSVSLADAAHDRWRLWSKITSRRLTSGSQHQII